MKRTNSSAILLALSTVCLVIACAAGTSMTARVNPTYQGTSFSKIFVFSTFKDLDLQSAIEEKLVASFRPHGVQCLFESWVQFHYDIYNADEFERLLDSSGCDAILSIVPAGSGQTQSYIPKTSSTTTSGSGRVDRRGNFNYQGKSTTREYGGYNVSKPWAAFEVTMYDASSFDIAWKASAKTGGNAFANWKTVVRSMAGQTVSKLAEQHLIE